MNLIFGFTGTKYGMTPPQTVGVYSILKKSYRGHYDEFHHGDCEGSDFQAATIADDIGYYVISHPPINPKHRGWFKNNDMVNPEFDYVVRDHHIVDDSNILIATPHTPYEITRSGTWTTIRYARKMKRDIYIVLPSGEVIHENHSLPNPA